MDLDGRNPVAIAYADKPVVTFDSTKQQFVFTYTGSKLDNGVVR